ncbi:MAG: hypothetical protein J0L63_00685 [Anaerolineae bacterium]|nr:hypothetical protein [Anaerolineae bacterium]MBN8617386.1 hypothetical protein [Anaerolineae bacterium]
MTASKKWYVANWSPLGWLETVVKLIALGAAIVALFNALSSGTFIAPSGSRLLQVIVLALLSLGLTVGILERYGQREIIAMIFILINNVGHWGMVYALLTLPGPGSLLIAFLALMLLGDLIKLIWLWTSGYTQPNASRSVLFGLVLFYIIGYLIVLVSALTSA